MNQGLFQRMYGYFLKSSDSEPMAKAAGEGSRGGKVIGHTASGKPIYDKDGHRDQPKGRLPYPGEEQHKLTPNEPQKRKTFMPPDGTEHGRYDSPNLKAYKTLMRQFKRQGIDFMGHISYDPKTDKMLALTPEAPNLIRKVYDSFMQDHQASAAKPKPKAG